jgi:NDP-sugar pyrophosphorylase family protein
MMPKLQLVIPAAGLGSRFTKIGINTPKPLINVKGKPMLVRVIENFDLTKEDDVIVVCMRRDEIPKNLRQFQNSIIPRLRYLEIETLSDGPADSVAKCEKLLDLDAPLIVANSDQYVTADITRFMDAVKDENFDGAILTMQASGNKWSYVAKNDQGLILNVVEKVEISTEATVGIYGWSRAESFFVSHDLQKIADDRVNNEFYVAPTYNYLISNGGKIVGIDIGVHGDAVHGLGTPEDLNVFLSALNFNNYLKE